MKKSYINLRHHQYSDIKQPHNKSRIRILTQFPHQSCKSLLSYLRLAQITILYKSLEYNHRCQDFKRNILNYMILSNRVYTKWEEKEFLDFIIEHASKQEKRESLDMRCRGHGQVAVTGSVQWRTNSEISENGNDKSRINRCKQSINNDVDRTYFKKMQKKRSSHLGSKQNSNQNTQNDRRIKSENNQNLTVEHQSQNVEAYPYYISLSTQPTLLAHPKKTSLKCIDRQSHKLHSESSSHLEVELSLQQRMQLYLKNTLLIVSLKYPIIGYIQGFNYIVKNMFLTGFSEEQACKYLSYFIEHKNLGRIILDNMSGVKKLSYVLKVYLFNYVPQVYKYFLQSQVQPQVFCTSWFITLFSQDLSVELVNKIWHLFVLEGWKIIIKFGVAFICAYQNQILAKEPDQIFNYMRRIMQIFNQECKGKIGRTNRIWDRASKKDEIVWKLMSSVQVNGTIMAQLCREMENMHNDSQIQIWRIQQNGKLLNSFQSRSRTRTSHSNLLYEEQQRKLTQSSTCSLNPRSSKICCDKLTNTQMVNCGQSTSRSNTNTNTNTNNIFSLCHNVDAYID